MEGDTAEGYLKFLLPSDLVSLAATCKYLHNNREIQIMFERTWMKLCLVRWRLSEQTLFALSTMSMKEFFVLNHERMRVPEGKYTGAGHVCFGKGKCRGLYGWLFIGHTPDAELKRTFLDGAPCGSIELRLCIQNTCHGEVRFLSGRDFVEIRALPSGESGDSEPIFLRKAEFIAKNGLVCPRSESMCLQAMEFAVLSLQVCCPEHVRNEPELVTMLDNITVGLTSKVQGDHVPLTLTVRPLDEGKVWDCYTHLPNGVVLLRSK